MESDTEYDDFLDLLDKQDYDHELDVPKWMQIKL